MLYPAALKCGINTFDFWDYTYGEIIELIKLHKENEEEKSKEQLVNNYQIALLTSVFTNRANNGKQPPTLHEVFPNVFDEEVTPEEAENNSWLFYKEQMMDYTLAHNRLAKEVSENDN